MKKRNLKKGVAIEMSLLVLIVVTFASALILSLAVVSTKENKNAFASLQDRIYMEEVAKDILVKRYLNYSGGNWEVTFDYGENKYTFTKNDNDYRLNVNDLIYVVKFGRGSGDNKTLTITRDDEIVLITEVSVVNEKITIVSWEY